MLTVTRDKDDFANNLEDDRSDEEGEEPRAVGRPPGRRGMTLRRHRAKLRAMTNVVHSMTRADFLAQARFEKDSFNVEIDEELFVYVGEWGALSFLHSA